MPTRYATLSAGFVKRFRLALLWLLAIIPWVLGLMVGLIVTVTLWCVVAAMDGYRTGRWYESRSEVD